MPEPQDLKIELNPLYLKEVQSQFDDVNAAIHAAIPWLISRITLATSSSLPIEESLDELDHDVACFRAFVACEIYISDPVTQKLREQLCEWLSNVSLTPAGRYQLAEPYCRLGVEARQLNDWRAAIDYAKKGLELLEGLPLRPIMATLHYNIAIALERWADFEGAISEFLISAKIDEFLNNTSEASKSRQRAATLQELISDG